MVRLILIPLLGFLLISPEPALSEEKSVIIGFKQKPGLSELALIPEVGGVVDRIYHLIPAIAACLPGEEIENLRNHPKIDYIEENGVCRALAEPPTNSEYDNSWGVSRISADVAHASGNKGAGVTIAVLDTGVDYTHEDLAGNYQGGYDFGSNDNDPFDGDPGSHGTHVAGIIVAENNGRGVVGVAPEADLLAVKVADENGDLWIDDIIEGIQWAVDNGANIINMSFGRYNDHQALRDACDAAYDAGVLLVASAGNEGVRPVEYPAAYDSVIAVAATDSSDVRADFSAIGVSVELAAPGKNVRSTVAGGGYRIESGTSMAAPHVAGTAALYFSSNTEDLNGDGAVNHKDLRLILQRRAMDLGDEGKDEFHGYGLVDAAAASFTFVPPDRWNVTTTATEPEAFTITIQEYGGSLVITKDDGVNRPSLAFGIEFVGVIFWMDIWMDVSGNAFWGTGDTYFGNINRTAGTMSGIVFEDTGGVATFTATK